MGIVMTQQGDAVAGELATEKWVLKGIWPFFSRLSFFPEFFRDRQLVARF